VPLVSGLIFSVAAGTGALGHHVAGRLLRVVRPRLVLVTSALVGSAALGLFGAASATWMLFVATPVFGACVGVAMTTSYAVAGSVIPTGAGGAGFGMLTTASLSGLALSPIVSGALASASLRAVFGLGTLGLVVLSIVVARLMSEPAAVGPAGAHTGRDLV
jgi:MFS family permease